MYQYITNGMVLWDTEYDENVNQAYANNVHLYRWLDLYNILMWLKYSLEFSLL